MAYIIDKCKYCGSTELYLEAKDNNPDILNAKVVNVKCKNCGKWLGYANKGEREHYLGKSPETPLESEKEQDKAISQENEESAPYKLTSDKNYITTEELAMAMQENGKEVQESSKNYEYTNSKVEIEPNVELKDTIRKSDIMDYIKMQQRIVGSTFTFDKGKALTILNNLIQYINSCN